MSIVVDVIKELFGMFLADAGLTTAILVLVAAVAGIVHALHGGQLLAGAILVVGCLMILIEATLRETQRRNAR